MTTHKSSLKRRHFLKLGAALAAVGSADWISRADPARAEAALSPEAALDKLMAGNQRFVKHTLRHPDQTEIRVLEVAQAQHPFATILSCADSRVPGEIIFDQGLGDVFDVRVAGNVVTPEVLGSLEYAVVLLETPLLMVLGHERCGAVTAAAAAEALPGDISTFVNAILPAVDQVKGEPGDLIDNAVTANVKYQLRQLQRSPLIAERLQSGQLKVVGGRYDLDTGSVTLVA
jgi:carbonic anhydrase